MSGMEKRGKWSLSLLETVCMLGMLVLVSVFLLQLFAGADSLKRKARDINRACSLAEGMVDTLKACPVMKEAIHRLGLIQIQDNYSTAIYEKYYDGKWKEEKKPDVYRVIVTVELQQVSTNHFYDITIVVKKEKDYPFIRNHIGNELASLHIISDKPQSRGGVWK